MAGASATSHQMGGNTMDFGWSEEQLALRKEVRDFIANDVDKEKLAEGGGEGGGRNPYVAELRKKAAEKGWVAIAWPKEYGGGGGDQLTQYLVEEEFTRAGLPIGGGAGSGAGAILAAGTEEQKAYFVPKVISGEISFALGFTEPQGGADLAGLQCRAVRDGDFYVINGQKMFTSSAHVSSHIYMMVRTDPDAPKHRGISILIFPMDTPGITVRPLWSIQNDPQAPPGTTYGTARTNETFFEDVRVPVNSLLGEENMGWYVGAMGLNLDRVGASRYVMSIRRDEDIINWAKTNKINGHSIIEEPEVRDKLAELWIEAQVCRLMTLRSMSIVMREGKDFTYEGSAEKVWAPEHGVKTTEAIAQMLGPYGQLLNTSPRAIESGIYAHNLMGAFQSGINHGSVQIMRDQVARRGLGLPRG